MRTKMYYARAWILEEGSEQSRWGGFWAGTRARAIKTLLTCYPNIKYYNVDTYECVIAKTPCETVRGMRPYEA
jgi:hypothetical protein